VTRPAARLGLVAGRDAQRAQLLEQLLSIATARLAAQYADGEFVFTTIGEATPAGGWQLRDSGRSVRYAAIAALGLLRLPEAEQRSVLAGQTAEDLTGLLAKKLDEISGVGDAALICWAAAEAGHSELPHAVTRLGQLDRQPGPVDVVSAAWAVSALVAARGQVDVEEHLAMARSRLLAARGTGGYPHVIGGGAPWYRSHVGSFADQVYPVQALARLHHSAADPEALATANAVARVICRAQGAGGQWWWHYDSRTRAATRTWTRCAAGWPGWPSRPRRMWRWCSTSRPSPGGRWPGLITASWCAACARQARGCLRASGSSCWTGSTRRARWTTSAGPTSWAGC